MEGVWCELGVSTCKGFLKGRWIGKERTLPLLVASPIITQLAGRASLDRPTWLGIEQISLWVLVS
jgi:hypothetical protein